MPQDMMDILRWRPLNIPILNENDALPLVLDPARPGKGGGIEATLRRTGEKYHMICRLAFNNTKLDSAK